MIPALNASKIYSTLGSSTSLIPLALKDTSNSLGLTAGSYITGEGLESKDRFIDEFGTQAIWLLGIPTYKKAIDLTLYKLLGIDPKFDVRNLSDKRSKLLEKSLEYADSSIKENIKKAVKNPKFTKTLALTKFAASTILTIFTYNGLTKYRHEQTRKRAEKEILAEIQNKNYSYTKPENKQAFSGIKKQIAFTGGIQDFMFNPVKNLMILDASITAERLADSRNKQELMGYTVKEGTFWMFMYLASKPIQKFFEKRVENNTKTPASIDLDARVIESKELEEAFKNGELTKSTSKILKLKTQEELLDYIHNNPDDFTVKMAKKSDIIPTINKSILGYTYERSEKVDYRKFIDLEEFKEIAEKLNKLNGKFELYKQTNAVDTSLEAFLKNVKKFKRQSVLKNIGICISVLGVIAPGIMVAMRKFGKDNEAFQVKEDLKKELAFNGKI